MEGCHRRISSLLSSFSDFFGVVSTKPLANRFPRQIRLLFRLFGTISGRKCTRAVVVQMQVLGNIRKILAWWPILLPIVSTRMFHVLAIVAIGVIIIGGLAIVSMLVAFSVIVAPLLVIGRILWWWETHVRIHHTAMVTVSGRIPAVVGTVIWVRHLTASMASLVFLSPSNPFELKFRLWSSFFWLFWRRKRGGRERSLVSISQVSSPSRAQQ
mmetsp:Transcript_53851/g.155475  ORF Transcript_53851/g.155475 Transcript_53851/m.155475 type:complete len:213 (-) Transcript_53851:70-708(-)